MQQGARLALALLALGALALLAAACGRSEDESVEVTANGSPVPPPPTSAVTTAPTETATLPPIAPTSPPSNLDPEDLRGFAQPLEGACLPGSDLLMPNAPREYRNGFHEGVDVYDLSACVPVGEGTPVLAMYDGVVLRADLDYVDITAQQVTELAERTASQGFSDEQTLDIYRGQQVWIDHGNGVVTRYAHLLTIGEGIAAGAEVARGQVIGTVGESGTPESVIAPGTDMHLHYEVRVGDGFLGDGLGAAEVRALYERLFGPPAPIAGASISEDGESE
jgi:murein DD-endopeptidase MepM/ murein hydrolase activator NlpD